MTMPRRELCAAVLLSLVMHTVVEALADSGLNITKKRYYTDSMNALYWIISDHYNWPKFIANRIKQARDLTDTDDWGYVHTSQNPADLPSRGCLIEELKDSKLFREGPDFLVTGEAPFLGKMDLSDMPEGCRSECPKVALAGAVTPLPETVNLTEIFPHPSLITNSYHRLMNVTRYVYKAAGLIKAKRGSIEPESWSKEKVELDWLRSMQMKCFADEIAYCKSNVSDEGKNKVKPALVKALSLFWDEDSQLLRCSTRLQEADIRYESSNPVLVPRDEEFTTMLITSVHERVGHVGVKQTLSALRADYWIPQARRLVKQIVNRCLMCRRISAAPFDLPHPPPLPKSRVTMSRPFSNLGVDFCGPFRLRRSKKYYVAVFTCAVTRAVHFEAVEDLSAESFLLAFKRLIGRRGVPELIISPILLSTAKSFVRKAPTTIAITIKIITK